MRSKIAPGIAPGSALLALALSACAASLEGGVLQQPALDPKGASLTVRGGMGGGAMRHSRYLVAFGPDTRVDVASGGSRWTIGASLLGGVRLGARVPHRASASGGCLVPGYRAPTDVGLSSALRNLGTPTSMRPETC